MGIDRHSDSGPEAGTEGRILSEVGVGEFDECRGKPLGQVLKLMELIGEGQIQEALQIQRKQGGLIGEILIHLGYIAREELLLALAAQSGKELLDQDEGGGGSSAAGASR
jgi:hypothetical protein